MTDNSSLMAYITDSNVFIDLDRRHYPRRIFPSLWERMDHMMTTGRIIVPEEVVRELERIDDDLLKWVKSFPNAIRGVDDAQICHLRKVLAEFPDMVDSKKVSATAHADPFIVSLALAEMNTVSLFPRPIAVWSHEQMQVNKMTIPKVCQHYNIPCVNLFKVCEQEDWQF